MKKQKIQFIVLAVICIVCIGGYFLLKNMDFSQEEEETETVVTDFSKDDVKELTVTGDHELHFVREGDSWTESSIPDEVIKESSVNYLLTLIDNITTTETVVEASEDLSEYGLEEPVRTIRAVLNDDTAVTIYAGSESELLSKYYIQVEGDANVYLVSSYIVTEFEKDPDYFIEEEETESETETAGTEETVADDADETADEAIAKEGESESAESEALEAETESEETDTAAENE